jgi:hypothetical protein
LTWLSNQLIQRHKDSITFISSDLSEVNAEVCLAKLSLEQLSTKAEIIAPKAEWYARLGEDDLPADLNDVIQALQISTLNLNSFDATRSSKYWHDRVHKLREGVEMLFQLLDVDSRKSQRDDDLSHVSVHHLEEAPQKKRRLDSTIEKVNANELTPNSISAMFRMYGTQDNPAFKPILQVVHLKRIDNKWGVDERWKVCLCGISWRHRFSSF